MRVQVGIIALVISNKDNSHETVPKYFIYQQTDMQTGLEALSPPVTQTVS